jgi:hypothetical protein
MPPERPAVPLSINCVMISASKPIHQVLLGSAGLVFHLWAENEVANWMRVAGVGVLLR